MLSSYLILWIIWIQSLPKRSFLSSFTLFKTLAHNTTCEVCETLKLNEVRKGREVSETDRKLTKICWKLSKGPLNNFWKFTKCQKHKQEILIENTENKIIWRPLTSYDYYLILKFLATEKNNLVIYVSFFVFRMSNRRILYWLWMYLEVLISKEGGLELFSKIV